jgi:perosamine synthetase
MPTVVFAPETKVTRKKLQIAFAAENIDARVFFWPLSSLSMFSPVATNLNALSIPNRAINLPSYHDITQNDLERVAETIEGLLKYYGKPI